MYICTLHVVPGARRPKEGIALGTGNWIPVSGRAASVPSLQPETGLINEAQAGHRPIQSSYLTHFHSVWGHREVGATAPASEVKLLKELFIRHIQDEQKQRSRAIRTLRLSLKVSPVFGSFLLERDMVVVIYSLPSLVLIYLSFTSFKNNIFLSFLFYPLSFYLPSPPCHPFPFETESSVA